MVMETGQTGRATRDSTASAAPLPYPSTSLPLSLPSDPNSPFELPLFDATSTSSQSRGSKTLDDISQAEDILLFAGGPVWALTWCPGPPLDGNDYLAVACHPPGKTQHVIGEPCNGPHDLQLWAVPHQPLPSSSVWLPHVVSLLRHNGGLIWSLAWCPDPNTADEARLGLIAGCRGDGKLCLYTIPRPSREIASTRQTHADQDLLVGWLDLHRLLGTLPSSVDWAGSAPWDQLVVGCWDGSAVVVRVTIPDGRLSLPGDSSSIPSYGLEILSRIPASPLSLRSVAFLPPDTTADEKGRDRSHLHKSESHVFAATGHDGTISIWDTRDTVMPQYTQLLTTGCVYALGWTADPRGLLVACEDAAMRGILVDAALLARNAASNAGKLQNSFSWRGTAQGALWALSVEPRSQLVAYGGEDGVAAVFTAGFQQDSRKRRPHQPVGGFKYNLETGALHVLTVPQLSNKHGLFMGKTVERLPALKGQPLPPEEQCILRMAWHPTFHVDQAQGKGRLAMGLACGIIRIQTVYTR